VETLIVDGYNVIHAWAELKAELTRGPLEAARRRLIALLAEYAAVRQAQVTVVFDGPRTATAAEVEVIDGVSVRFSGRSGSADHLIERLAYDATRAGDSVTVATTDRLQRDLVRAMGAVTIDAASFELEVREALVETARGAERLREVARLAQRVEDLIPRDVAAQLEAIRRGLPVPPPAAQREGRPRRGSLPPDEPA
jgi:predicted RNA-binding protein with PIN domain